MDWDKAVKKEDKLFEIPESWLLIHYYEVLTTLFRIENALRVFVFSILKNELKDKWSGLSITSDDSQEGTIETIAKKRINQAKDFGYLGYFVSCPIMYLTTGELIRLITAETYWKYFAKYFLGSKAIMKNKLDEIVNVRNSIAHFRPIKQGDVELIKQNAAHALGAIELCILQITNCRNVVPTNTQDSWYKELKTLGTDNSALSLYFSDNEEWLRIELKYNCPIILRKTFGQRHVFYRLLSIISPSVLKMYPSLTSHIICLSEDTSNSDINKDFYTDFFKHINIVISKKTINEDHETICSQIKELLTKVSEETDLIKQDNLASGRIVKTIDAYATYRETQERKYWSYNTDELICSGAEDSPPEFWGGTYFPTANFISDSYRYPWMPVAIAREKLPW